MYAAAIFSTEAFRGLIRPTATLEMRRSKSAMPQLFRQLQFNLGKISTTFSRSSINAFPCGAPSTTQLAGTHGRYRMIST